jgi:hypothetical protein
VFDILEKASGLVWIRKHHHLLRVDDAAAFHRDDPQLGAVLNDAQHRRLRDRARAFVFVSRPGRAAAFTA